MTADNDRFWSRPLVAALGTFTFIYLSHIMLMSILPGYIVGKGGDKPTAGLAVSILSFTALLGRPIFGRMLDTVGRRAVIICGAVLFFLGTTAQFFFPEIVPLLAFRVLQGLGFSAATTAAGVIFADLLPHNRLSEGLGLLQISFAACFAVGPAAGLALYAAAGYRPLFALAIAVAALGIICAVATRYETPRTKETSLERPPKKGGTAFGGTGAVVAAIAIVSFFVQTAMGCVMAFVPLYGKSLNIGYIAFFFPTYAAAAIISVRSLGTAAANRFGREPILILCIILIAASMGNLAAAQSPFAFLLSGAVFGLGFGTSVPLLGALMLNNSPIPMRGTTNAINFAAMDIAMTLGPFVAGFIAQQSGYRSVYAAAAVSVLCGLGVFLAFVRGRA
ncbi:MAG: MFS transporter, partial [Treponemataceae bacterium]